MTILLFLIFILNIFGFSLPSLREQNKVVLHLEKFNEKFDLLHIGISFNNDYEKIRFDFRPNNYGKTYLTSEKDRLDFNFIFPNTDINIDNLNINSQSLNDYRNLIIFDTKNIKKKNIFWGITNKTQYEIIEFEKDISINRRYKLGLYDCRHFVN